MMYFVCVCVCSNREENERAELLVFLSFPYALESDFVFYLLMNFQAGCTRHKNNQEVGWLLSCDGG